MTDIEKIKQEIQENLDSINDNIAHNILLKEKLNILELKDWQPDSGNFTVLPSGVVFDAHTGMGRTPDGIVESEVSHGSVRATLKQAHMASKNMRRFNRLSCFFGDSKPVLEYSPFSVALVFYDYEPKNIEKLRAVMEVTGEL